MQTVEFEQVRDHRGAALQLVDMRNVEPVAGAWIVVRPLHRAESRPQREAADTAHAVDPDTHRQPPCAFATMPTVPSPISSSRARTAMRSSFSKGRFAKAVRRR